MKKAASIGLALLLVVILAACAPAASIKAGSATGEALLRLLPKATTGIMAVDIQRAAGSASTVKALENPQARQKYDEFVSQAGIDPLKDVYLVVLGLVGNPTAKAPDGGIIVNLKFDRNALLTRIREKAADLKEETYNGVAVYSGFEKAETGRTTRAAFLDDSNILVGSEAGVKGIIDVHQKKAESVMKNADMTAILKSVDKTAIAWGVFAVPPGLVAKGTKDVPQLKVLEGVKALTVSFDERLSKHITDVRTLGGTKEQNDSLASTLTGLKGLGAMFAAQEPAFGEFLNAVEISSGKDFTRLYISVSAEVMDKLRKAAQAMAEKTLKAKRGQPQEEIK